MSGNGNGVQIPLGITPVNVLGAWQTGATIGQTQANALQTLAQRNLNEQQAGLVGQQAAGAGISNQMLGARLGLYNEFMGQPSSAPASNALAALPVPTGSAALMGSMTGAAGSAASSPPNALSTYAAIDPQAAEILRTVPYNGTTKFGASLPNLMVANQFLTGKPITDLLSWRNQTLATRAAEATTPQAWNQTVVENYHQGLIDQTQFLRSYGHFELRDTILRSLAPPTAQISTQATLSGQGLQPNPNGNGLVPLPAAAAAKGAITAAQQGNTNVTVSPTSSTSLSPAAAAYRNGGAGGAATPTSSVLATPGPLTPQQWLGKVQSTEGGAPGVTSATSSATGPYQFTRQTWNAISGGLPLSEANNPAVAGPLAVKLATQNAAALQGAGMPVNSATLGLAHFLGAPGATAVMRDPVGTPMVRAVPADVVQANPWVRGLTTGQVAQRFAQNYGLQPVQLGAAVPGFQVQGPQPAGAGAATQATPGGGETISSTLTPGAVAGQTELAKGWPQEQAEFAAEASSATQQNGLLDQMKVDSQGWTSGSFVSWREAGVKALDTLGRMVGFTPSQDIGNYQAFEKNFVQLNAAAARAISSRVPLGEWEGLQKGLPNAELSPTGFSKVVAELQGYADWKIARSIAAARYNGQGGAPAFNAQWTQSAPVMPFILHRMDPESAKRFGAALAKVPGGVQLGQALRQKYMKLQNAGVFNALPHGQ